MARTPSLPNLDRWLRILWNLFKSAFAADQLPCYAALNARETQCRGYRAGKAGHRISIAIGQGRIPNLRNCFADPCIRAPGPRARAYAEGSIISLPERESGRWANLALRA